GTRGPTTHRTPPAHVRPAEARPPEGSPADPARTRPARHGRRSAALPLRVAAGRPGCSVRRSGRSSLWPRIAGGAVRWLAAPRAPDAAANRPPDPPEPPGAGRRLRTLLVLRETRSHRERQPAVVLASDQQRDAIGPG